MAMFIGSRDMGSLDLPSDVSDRPIPFSTGFPVEIACQVLCQGLWNPVRVSLINVVRSTLYCPIGIGGSVIDALTYSACKLLIWMKFFEKQIYRQTHDAINLHR